MSFYTKRLTVKGGNRGETSDNTLTISTWLCSYVYIYMYTLWHNATVNTWVLSCVRLAHGILIGYLLRCPMRVAFFVYLLLFYFFLNVFTAPPLFFLVVFLLMTFPLFGHWWCKYVGIVCVSIHICIFTYIYVFSYKYFI